jgi:uncharacterized protein YjbI with pentapeptide repeats
MAKEEQLAILKQGVEVWNRWREENLDIAIDLQEAHLRGINLNSVNLSGANLSGANLREADLNRANLCDTDLRAVNFARARLIEANLKNSYLCDAYLGSANLKRASLIEAKLMQTLALYANFNNANLTGACIEDWNINSKTQFSGVICEYIYLKCEIECEMEKDEWIYTDRRPSDPSKIFAPGDFARLVQQTNETIDLIFREGVDWNAFLNSFQNLQTEGNYGELSIQAIEKKHDGFVIKLETPEDVDKGEIETNFKLKYETELKLLETKYRSQLQAKDREIEIYKQQNTDILELAKLASSRPITVETRAMVDQSKSDRIIKIKTQEIHGSAYTEGNTIYHETLQNPSLVEAAKEIQELLKQLEANNPTTTTSEQMAIATKAVQQIESDPSLKQKAINAVKSSAFEALKQTSIGAIVVAAIEGWTKR